MFPHHKIDCDLIDAAIDAQERRPPRRPQTIQELRAARDFPRVLSVAEMIADRGLTVTVGDRRVRVQGITAAYQYLQRQFNATDIPLHSGHHWSPKFLAEVNAAPLLLPED